MSAWRNFQKYSLPKESHHGKENQKKLSVSLLLQCQHTHQIGTNKLDKHASPRNHLLLLTFQVRHLTPEKGIESGISLHLFLELRATIAPRDKPYGGA
ncbi:hypothetical protein N7452_010526 [Penicillium brevicompactum]|uniref:Uncharacterized protein n=1 Tax=Penicillium brevicompactum TaxID=5074 RepID=A0A9W9QAN2_PENBR|nr:hypothetical protein N7452_010526 [Penicillium brevicompactum]